MHDQLPKEVEEMPLSGRTVYLALEGNALDQDGLADRTALSKRRIRDVANDLADAGLISAYNHPQDQRRQIYYDPAELDIIEAHQTYISQQSEN